MHLDNAEEINVCADNLVSSSCGFNSVASIINLEFHIIPTNFVQLPGTILVVPVFSYRLDIHDGSKKADMFFLKSLVFSVYFIFGN